MQPHLDTNVVITLVVMVFCFGGYLYLRTRFRHKDKNHWFLPATFWFFSAGCFSMAVPFWGTAEMISWLIASVISFFFAWHFTHKYLRYRSSNKGKNENA